MNTRLPIVRTATKNILVFKRLQCSYEHIQSGYRYIITNRAQNGYSYPEGSSAEKEKIGIHTDGFFKYRVERGYHSRRKTDTYNGTCNAIFIIPKGAKYVTGGENRMQPVFEKSENYVSNTIVFMGELTNEKLAEVTAKLQDYKFQIPH